jgi:hypothetical protein
LGASVTGGALWRALLLAALGCAAGCAAGSGAAESPAVAFEAEAAVAGGSAATDAPIAVEAECASGRRALAIGGDPVRLSGAIPAAAGRLWLRLSCRGDPAGAALEIEGTGEGRVVVEVPDTLHRERFEWVRACELPFATGEHAVCVRRIRGGEVLVDQWAVLPERARPDEAWSPALWRSRDGSLELRAAQGAKGFDPAWILHLLEEQRDAVASRLGARLERPLVLIALPAARWPSERSGAFQNGCAILLRDDELHLPWRSYAHEIAHLHEDERDLDLPWFLSEGIACALALEVEERILGAAGPVAEKHAALDRLLREGDSWHRPASREGNAVFLLDEEPPLAERRDAAYAWATALLRGAARRGGEGFWRRLLAALAREPAFDPSSPAGEELDEAGRRLLALAASARVLREAAGRPLDDLFVQLGFVASSAG